LQFTRNLPRRFHSINIAASFTQIIAAWWLRSAAPLADTGRFLNKASLLRQAASLRAYHN
jgi:hypothetical protein